MFMKFYNIYIIFINTFSVSTNGHTLNERYRIFPPAVLYNFFPEIPNVFFPQELSFIIIFIFFVNTSVSFVLIYGLYDYG